MVARYRDEYSQQQERLASQFLADGSVDQYLERHSDLIDGVIRSLAAPWLELGRFCVIATAGYGRQEQFPGSDVDLLVVHRFSRDRAERIIGPFLNSLWDTRLILGHQVWGLEDLSALTLEDLEFVLALFNSRFITGDAELAQRVIDSILPSFVASHEEQLIRLVVDSTRSRHERFGNTIYQLEPDLKEAPGGLRDHLAGTWLERLMGRPGYLPYSNGEIGRALQFVKRLRILLHLKSRRTDNRLTHAMQEKLVRHVGLGGIKTQSAVESLMREYFLNARVLAGYCSAMLRGTQPPEVDNFLRLDELPRPDQPESVLEIFQRSLEENRLLSDESRNAIVESLPALSQNLRSPSLRGPLVALLKPREGLYRTLSELYELGVLELLFPEFGSIKARVIRDFYHKYTVDEHTLIAIKSIEDLLTGESGADSRFATILSDTVVPHHLSLALLLHDVGKSRGGKHTDQSARLAARALRRFRFEREEINTVVFLIRNHLAMSAVIFRRDIEDDEVIRRFSNLVEDTEKLRLLTLLTYADIKAVAPGTLNDWKKDLLWQLYLETYRKLTLEVGADRIEEEDIGERLLKELGPDVDPFDFEHFLEGFPTRYLRTTPPEEIYEHYQMATRIGPSTPIETNLVKRKTFHELCVVTPDRSHLFANIVGLLSYFEMNILRGFGFANRRQTILDFFQFSDERQFFRHSEERKRFQELLRRAVLGEVSVRELLKSKEESPLFRRTAPRFEPTLYFEDEHSDRFTILEIIAPDALGLLYRISAEIAHLNCDIDLALISTEGDKVVDVFYLCQQGCKLSPELKEQLAARILKAVAHKA